MPGMPSEPTLRKLIAEHADFPIISRGKNGQAYEIDLEVAFRWIMDLRKRIEDEARSRSEEVRQLGLQLLGDDALAVSEQTVGLTPNERKAILEEEFLATKLAVQRGELVRKSEVEVAIAQFVLGVAERLSGLSAQLAKRTDLSRAAIGVLDQIVEKHRREIADELEKLGNAPSVAEGNTAV